MDDLQKIIFIMNVAVQVLLQLHSHFTTCILTFVNSEPFLIIIISYVLDFRLSLLFPQAVCRITWPSAVERRPITTRSCPTTIIRTHTRRGADRFCGCAVWLDSRLRYVPHIHFPVLLCLIIQTRSRVLPLLDAHFLCREISLLTHPTAQSVLAKSCRTRNAIRIPSNSIWLRLLNLRKSRNSIQSLF